MAWNQPSSDKRPTKHAPRWGRGVVAGFVFVFLAVAAVLFLRRDDQRGESNVDRSITKGRIASVDPDVATNRVRKTRSNGATAKPTKKKKYDELTREEKLAYFRDKYGDNLPENLKPIVYYLENPPKKNFEMPKRPESIFKHHSERTIASFLMVTPGTWMMKPIEFGASFDADFAAALVDEIEFNDDDTDDQRELKNAVVETKKELAERIKNGEKASEILTETSRQLYELGQYRSNLESQINKIRKDASMSDQDVQDAVKAANEMLEEKGLPPLKMPNMIIRHISLKRAAQKAAEKANHE